MAVAPNSSVNLVDGDSTRSTLLSNGPFVNGDSWSLAGGWSIAGGKATHATGSTGTLSQNVAFVAGKFYRLGYVVSDRSAGSVFPLLSGGSDRQGTYALANGQWLDRIQAVTGNVLFSFIGGAIFDGSIDDVILYEETGACVDQGTYAYYVEPENSSGNPGPVSGPFEATII